MHPDAGVRADELAAAQLAACLLALLRGPACVSYLVQSNGFRLVTVMHGEGGGGEAVWRLDCWRGWRQWQGEGGGQVVRVWRRCYEVVVVVVVS